MLSSSFRLITVITAVIALAACGTSRSLDKSFSDISASTELKAALFTDRSHDYGDIDITLYEGRLLLTGTMRSEDGRRKLVENAWKADGITQVIDEIFVGDKTRFGQGFEDSRIDQVLRTRLIVDGDVKNGDYKIAVSRAVVFLIGSARDQNDLDAALQEARSISGVVKVVSYVTLRNNAVTQ